MTWPDGFLLVDKPAGVTSRTVVSRVQRALGPSGGRKRGAPRFRCGHAGTLDPMATGLLVVLVGAGTRLSHYLLGHDKTYDAVVRFGVATDTLDAEGEVTASAPPTFDSAQLTAAITARIGTRLQVPPLVSAIKRDGRSLHRRVRDGEDVAPPEARLIRIDDLVQTGPSSSGPGDGTLDVPLRVLCGSGTYVRSLARDLGEDLGTLAHLAALRRVRIGAFDVADAVAPTDLDDSELLRAALRPLATALPELPVVVLDADEAAAVRSGHQPDAAWLDRADGPPAPIAAGREPLWTMIDASGGLVAVGRLGPDPEGVADGLRPRTAAVFPHLGETSCS